MTSRIESGEKDIHQETLLTHHLDSRAADTIVDHPLSDDASPSLASGSSLSTQTTQTFDPAATAYELSISSPLQASQSAPSSAMAERPLSLLLAGFSHRATVCLSSLELLQSDAEKSIHLREPTRQQIELVEEQMKEETKVVERAIEAAVENRGVDERVETPEMGTTYFDEMKKVRRRCWDEFRLC